MKTLSASIELSSLALESIQKPQNPKEILKQVRSYLETRLDLMGPFKGCNRIEKRHLDRDLQLEYYDLQYKKHTLRLGFLFFRPRGAWQVQGFRFVS